MSFSTEIKDEVSVLDFSYMEDTVFLSAFVRNNGYKSLEEIIVTNENLKVIRKMYSLFKELFDISPVVSQIGKAKFNSKVIYQLHIKNKVKEILTELMVYDDDYIARPKDYFVDSEDLKRSYLRGAFLATGSVNDPKTSSYHLEFFLDTMDEAEFIISLLNYFMIPAKVINRDKGYMVYVKESEKIADFLRVISANRAVMYYEDIRIYRDHKNMTNRLNNCEQANVDKIILTAHKQLEDINYIVEKLGMDLIPDRLKDVALYRTKYPDVSIQELSEIISYETGKAITKSGISHRFRKIKELADSLRNN